MTDHNRGESKFLLVLCYHAQDSILPDRILACSRFVKKHYFRVRNEGASQSHPLLHTARNFRRVFVRDFGKFQLLHFLLYLNLNFSLAQFRRSLERQSDIFKDRE